MRELKVDGVVHLTDDVKLADLARAMKDPANRTISLHRPGEVIEIKGRKFRVAEHGHWIPVTEDG